MGVGSINAVLSSDNGYLAKGKSIAEEKRELISLQDARLFTKKHPLTGGLNCALKHHMNKQSEENIVGKELNGLNVAPTNDYRRKRVVEVINRFREVFTELSEEQQMGANPKKHPSNVPVAAARILRMQRQWLNTGKQFGDIPGVIVGDGFKFRAEVVIIGLHHQFENGIDYMKNDGVVLATSIVHSGRYANETEFPDVLIYCGHGGNPSVGGTRGDDQKLEGGNLALKNSIKKGNPIRVIRGLKDFKSIKYTGSIYIYDGLYSVVDYWQEIGELGKLVFKFELKRRTGQVRPRLASSTLMVQPSFSCKTKNKWKNIVAQKPLRIADISQGKEGKPIQFVNGIDDEKLPCFNYINKMMDPKWYNRSKPSGCDCEDNCLDNEICSCACKNGGERPFNGKKITTNKPLVYECGPACKCSAACSNRLSQHGIDVSLEVFRTKLKEWGVKPRDYITKGRFICEFVGELIPSKDALGKADGGFTIDASRFSNVARFIGHSSTPNLYAQKVLYDHDEKSAPHIMLFAAKDIGAKMELTLDYHSVVGQICGSNGNGDVKFKIKNCYCGSKCSGWLY